MGAFLVLLGIGLTALLVVYATISALTSPVDPEDEEDDDDTDLYTPRPVDVVGCPLGVSTDTGIWVRAEGRTLKVEELKQ
jgi:hypothetical protein